MSKLLLAFLLTFFFNVEANALLANGVQCTTTQSCASGHCSKSIANFYCTQNANQCGWGGKAGVNSGGVETHNGKKYICSTTYGFAGMKIQKGESCSKGQDASCITKNCQCHYVTPSNCTDYKCSDKVELLPFSK